MKFVPVLAAICTVTSLVGATHLYRQSRQIMGTFCEVQVYDSNASRAESAIRAALDEMARIDHLLSDYDPASELSVMNREAAKGPFHASAELFEFVTLCRRFYDNTLGTFDPTVGALVRAWGFFSRQPGVPSAPEISGAKAASGFDKVRLNESDRTILYTTPELEMDPGGIGKGYAVDKAVAVLKGLGIRSALVSAGGSSMYGIGHPPGKSGWKVAISNPSDPGKPFALVDLRDNSLSSSGVSHQSVKDGAHSYSHIFDPRNGAPVENICQVTVVAPTGTETDALTKAAFILARDQVIDVLKRYSGAHALRVEGGCRANSPVWATPWSSAVFVHSP